jgi:hypothetical protein
MRGDGEVIRYWTEAEIGLMRQMKMLGHSDRAIGERLGRTADAVRLKMCPPGLVDRSCPKCDATVSRHSESGLCGSCARAARRKPRRHCGVCDKEVGLENKTGYCKPCNLKRQNASEAHRRAMQDGQRKALECPIYRARKAAIARQNAKTNAQRIAQDPVRLARARELALRHLERTHTPEANERRRAGIAKARVTFIDKRISWCPEEYRDFHRRNVSIYRISAAESRRMIEDQMRVDRQRARNALSPFERQMRALEAGAVLVANDQKPSLANPAYYGEVA